MEKFTVHTGIAVPLRRSDVDTDQIIPAEYLKRVTRTGFEDGLFNAWRADPSFVLNDPAYAGASILVAGHRVRRRLVARARRVGACRTTASGPSSRRRSATSSVTTPSRADCCRSCCRRRRSQELWILLEEQPGVELTVDLVAARQARVATRTMQPGTFALDEHSRWRLIEGLDDIGLTLRHEDAIADVRGHAPVLQAGRG